MVASQKVPSKPQLRPSFPGPRPRSKKNCYIITLPVISGNIYSYILFYKSWIVNVFISFGASENEPSSNIFSTSSTKQAVASIQLHHYRIRLTALELWIPLNRCFSSSSMHSRQNFQTGQRSYSVINIPIENESRIDIIQVSNATKEIL